MARNTPNMKVKATMDNSDLKKQAAESKAALKDFAQTGTNALDKLGSSFGVNIGKIDQMVSSIRGLGLRLKEIDNIGSQAIGNLLSSVNGLTAGLAGLGIAGIVAGFKLLNEEAEAFKKTVEGANIDLQTTAYIDTYRQVLRDFNKETGRNVAKAESSWKKTWTTYVATLKNSIVSGDAFRAIGTGDYSAFYEKTSAAKDAAREAEQIMGRMYELQREISDKSVEWARTEREIAEYKRIAYDKTTDLLTQQQAISSAVALINSRYAEEAEIRRQLADLQVQYNDLASSSLEDIDKANQLRIQEESVVARMNNALRELSERQASIATLAAKEAQERQKSFAAAQAMAASRASLAEFGQLSTPDMSAILPRAEQMEVPGLAFTVTPKLDTTAAINIASEMESLLTSSLDNIGMSVGSLIGDLMTGGDAWGNFANTAISAFGDMAIQIGKMAVSTGMATLGIKAALESLNGWVAIAAGTALIALGAAVKQGLSNIASGGGYAASSSVATASSSGGTSMSNIGFDMREMNVKVTGRLTGSGSSLVAIIEEENNRKNHTT